MTLDPWIFSAAGPAFAPLVTGAFIMLMGLLAGNAARLPGRQGCHVKARRRASRNP